MCETCNHIATYAALGKADPTRTTVLRQTFVRDVNRRFNRLKADIRTTVWKNDALGLGPQANVAAPVNAFNFPSSADKVEEFMKWFRLQVDREILSVGMGNQILPGQTPWTNVYITDSYARGVQRANAEAIKAGYRNVVPLSETGGVRASMATPFHADRLGLLYSRTFNELKGITAAMDSQISRILTMAIADGDNPKLAARKLIATISGGDSALGITDKLGRFIPAQRRAQTMARTEIIRAHHQATINEYESWAVEGIKVKAEWSTAGDDRVCEQCSGMEGNVYTLAEIRHMIPLHPNCRCLALPTEPIESKTKKTRGSRGPTVPKKKAAETFYPQATAEFDAKFLRGQTKRIKGVAKELGISPAEFTNKVETFLAKEMKDAKSYIRVPNRAIDKILEDGRLKTFFETGTSRGIPDVAAREELEHSLFSYGKNMPAAERPIYGFTYKGNLKNAPADYYGDLIFELKPGLKNRTTWVNGDSMDLCSDFNYKNGFAKPIPMSEANINSVPIWEGAEYSNMKEFTDELKFTLDEYKEIQVHKGIQTSDIYKVLAPEGRPLTATQIQALKNNNILYGTY